MKIKWMEGGPSSLSIHKTYVLMNLTGPHLKVRVEVHPVVRIQYLRTSRILHHPQCSPFFRMTHHTSALHSMRKWILPHCMQRIFHLPRFSKYPGARSQTGLCVTLLSQQKGQLTREFNSC